MIYNYKCGKCNEIYVVDEDRMKITREIGFVSDDGERKYVIDMMHAYCPHCGTEMWLVDENDTIPDGISEKENEEE